MDASMATKRERQPLTQERIVRAALKVADRESLEGLSIRKLAKELGVSPMAIYHHFPSKKAIVERFVDALLGDFEPEEAAGGARGDEWQEALEGIFSAVRRGFRAHPAVVSMIGTWEGVGEQTWSLMENVIGLLLEAGFSRDDAVAIFYALVSFSAGFAAMEANAQEQARRSGAEDPVAWRASLEEHFAQASSDEYPNVAESVSTLATHVIEGRFELGLRALIRGFAPARG